MLVFHIFGVIVWVGTMLVTCTMLALVPAEAGVAKQRLIVTARRLFNVGGNIGALATIIFGILAILAYPQVMAFGWLHVKLLLVLLLIAVHVRIYVRLNGLRLDADSATRREFSMLHGIVSLLLLGILIMVIVKPF
ncbi:MAG: CopD family protein [Candidatus Binataceae bacterium]